MEAQLRSELGPPDPPAPAREPRNLEAMLPGPRPAEPAQQPDADILLRGGMALYDDGRLRFGLPDKVVAFIAGRAVSVTQSTAYGWKLWPLEDGKPHKVQHTARPRRDGGRYILHASYSGDMLKPFGLESPADYMICDTHIEVDLRIDELQPVKQRKKPVSDGDPLPTESNDMPPFNNALEGLRGVDLPPAVDPLTERPLPPKEWVSPVAIDTAPEWLSSKEDTLRSVRYYEQVEGIHRMQRNKATGRMRWVPAAGIIELEDEA